MPKDYVKYLHSKNEENREHREHSTILAKATGITATALGVGLGALALRSGIVKDAGIKLGSVLSNGMRSLNAYGEAVGTVMQGRSVLSFLDSDVQNEIEKRLTGNLTKTYLNRTKGPMSGIASSFEKNVLNLQYMKKTVEDSYITSLRHQAIFKVMREGTNYGEETIASVEKLMKNKDGWKNANSVGGFQRYLHGHDVDTDKLGQDFMKDVYDMISRTKPENYGSWGQTYLGSDFSKVAIDKHIANLHFNVEKDVIAKFIEENNNSTFGRLLKSQSDYRHLTVEEAMKMHENGHNMFNNLKLPEYADDGTGKLVETGNMAPFDAATEIKELMKRHSELGKAMIDPGIYTNGTAIEDIRGTLEGMGKTIGFLANNFQLPFVKINPLRLFHYITAEGFATAPEMALLKAGTRQPLITGSAEELSSDIVVAGSKAYDITTGQLVKDNIDLASAQYGIFPRILSNMMGVEQKEAGEGFIGAFKNIFDIGMQNQDVELVRGLKGVTKFFDPEWVRNQYYAAKTVDSFGIAKEVTLPEAANKSFFDQMYKAMSDNVSSLDYQTLQALNPMINEQFSYLTDDAGNMLDLAMSNPDDVVTILNKMVAHNKGSKTSSMQRLRGFFTEYTNNPEAFFSSRSAVNQAEPYLGAFTKNETNLVSKVDMTRRAIHQEIISQMEASGSFNVSDLVKNNIVSGESQKSLNELLVLNTMEEVKRDAVNVAVNAGQEQGNEVYKRFTRLIQDPKTDTEKILANQLDDMVNKYIPLTAPGPASVPNNPFGDGVRYVAVNKAVNPLTVINEAMKNGGGLSGALDAFVKSTFGQIGIDFGFGFRAGSKNLGNVTTLTAGTYYYLDRINEAIGNVGLGLSPKSLGSLQDIWKNLTLKRIVYPAMAIGGIGYLNYEAGNVFGKKPGDKAYDTYANMKLDVAWAKDFVGFNSIGKHLNDIMPGLNQLTEESPVAMALNAATFGLLGSSKSEDDLYHEYTDTDVAVRKGRWWGLGNTPWMGGKVDYYRPGAYRLERSNYKMTDTLYGSEGEYWAHSFVPNPRNVFGLRTLLDPNWLAAKHREDRPYPTTGGYEELRTIPIVGPLADATIGNILNPERTRGDLGRAHRKYLRDINESIKSGLKDQEKGAFAYIMPGGGLQIVLGGVGAPVALGTGEDEDGTTTTTGGVYIPSSAAGGGHGGLIPVNPKSNAGQVVQMYGTNNGYGARISRGNLTDINQDIIGGAISGSMPTGGINALRNLDYIDDVYSLSSMNGLGFAGAESYYSMAEIGGMYGFISTSITGELETKQPVLADARAMASYRRSFWDMDLGGLGGDTSEIGRRFMPHDRRQSTYNPYRNKMPDWMPGCFIEGTGVFTNKGYKNIEEMQIGDKVLTHTGKFMTVQWVNKRNYKGKFITIEIDGIKDPITCTEDHPFLVMRTSGHKHDGYIDYQKEELKWIPASKIEPNDFVVSLHPISDYEIGALSITRVPEEKELFTYEMPLNYMTGQICGAYVANTGLIDNGLALCYNYSEIIGDFCYMFNIEPIYKKNSIEINERQLMQWFNMHFKKDTLPSWIYDTSEEFKAGFLSTYIDQKSNSKISNNEISMDASMQGLKELLATLGIYTDASDRIYLGAEDIEKLRILTGAFGKLKKFNKGASNTKHVPIKDNFALKRVKKLVEHDDETFVYNLQVAGDHTYNVYGIAVHNSEYFTDFQHGDPYTAVKLGEARLPGSAYKKLHKLHSDPIFGEYGAVERFKILGDVAPKSAQYKYYRKVLSLMNQSGMLSDEDKAVVAKTKSQVHEMNEAFKLYDYKFQSVDLDHEKLTVKYRIDNNTFLTEEHPNNPIRLGGIRNPNGKDDPLAQEISDYLDEYLKPGSKITVGMAHDAIQRMNNDVMNTIDAVVYDKWGEPIQAKLANKYEEVKVKDKNLSPVDVASLYSPIDISVGKLWESFAHLDTPFHTKFLQVRSGVEMYERRDVYGKAFQSWTNPIGDYIIPWWQNIARRGPITATLIGAGIGSMFGAKRAGRLIGAIVGGGAAGIMSSMRVLDELMSGNKFAGIPKRRQKEREIDEYFDKLKYMKFKALYERTARVAYKKEHVNIKQILENEGARGTSNKKLRNALEKKKQILKIRMSDPLVYQDRVKVQLDSINEKLKTIEQDKKLVKLGPISVQAIKFKDEYESTLYGMDKIDMQKIYKALPKRERQYFQSFATAPPKDRERILRLVPKNERRIFQMMWGMQTDKKEKLEDYFKSHYLPNSNWSGWRPDVDLDAIKVKVMKHEGVDLKDNGVWDDQPTTVRKTPSIKNMHKMSSYIDVTRLKDVLRGAGLRDVELQYSIGPADDANAIAINIDNHKSLQGDFTSFINDRGI